MSSTLPGPLAELVARMREEAEGYARDGALVRGDRLAERYADAIEAAWREWELEPLTVAEAAEVTRYSQSRLYALLERGKLNNAGRPGAPRILRRDLPRRPTGPDEMIDDLAARKAG